MLDVEGERIALKEQSEVIIFPEGGVVSDLLNALLECRATLAQELVLESTKGVLLRNGWYDHAGVVVA